MSTNWHSTGGTFRYKDTTLAASPVKTAVLKAGLLKVNAKGNGPTPITYRLGEPSQGSVGVIFTSGSTVLCANFGGTVMRDSGTNPPERGRQGPVRRQGRPRSGRCPTPPDTCP